MVSCQGPQYSKLILFEENRTKCSGFCPYSEKEHFLTLFVVYENEHIPLINIHSFDCVNTASIFQLLYISTAVLIQIHNPVDIQVNHNH